MGVGAYGRGAYVGVHAGLAHKYTSVAAGGRRHMFAVLVDVGTRLVQGTKDVRHSTTAVDRPVNPTQYVFVEADRLFVSHLITYIVLSDKGLAKALTKAVCRTDKPTKPNGAK